MSMKEEEVKAKIQELKIAKQLLSRDTNEQIRSLYISLQELQEAKLAAYAIETLKLKEISIELMGLVISINAYGKWDVWLNLSAHIDQIEVSISRREDFTNKLYQSDYYYRFSNPSHIWRTVETEINKALTIKAVLNDFANDNDPEQHFNTKEW